MKNPEQNWDHAQDPEETQELSSVEVIPLSIINRTVRYYPTLSTSGPETETIVTLDKTSYAVVLRIVIETYPNAVSRESLIHALYAVSAQRLLGRKPDLKRIVINVNTALHKASIPYLIDEQNDGSYKLFRIQN